MNEYLKAFSDQEADVATRSLGKAPETIALLDRLMACITHGVSFLSDMPTIVP